MLRKFETFVDDSRFSITLWCETLLWFLLVFVANGSCNFSGAKGKS